MIRTCLSFILHLIMTLVLVEGMGVISKACVDCSDHEFMAQQHHADSDCGHETAESCPDTEQHSCACNCHAPSTLVESDVCLVASERVICAVADLYQTALSAIPTEIDHPPLVV